MKKILLYLIIFSSFTLNGVAQITLTSSDAPKVGDVTIDQAIDASTLLQGPSGANQTWDFSSVTTSGSPGTGTYVAPSSTSYASQFPSATVALSEAGSYVFEEVNSSSELLLGDEVPGAYTIYTTPEAILNFPFTYNTHFTTTFAGNGMSSYAFTRSGTATVTADGYGKLITPAGTMNNVLRVKTVQVFSDTFPSIGIAYDYNYTTYDWFINGYPSAVFNISYDTTTVFGVPTVVNSGYYSTNAPAGIASVSVQPGFNIWPNPVASAFYINSAEKVSHIEIVNLLGAKLIDFETNNVSLDKPFEISLADLPNGIYICNAITPSGIISRKIVKAE